MHRKTQGNLMRIVRVENRLAGVCRAWPHRLLQRHGLPITRMPGVSALPRRIEQISQPVFRFVVLLFLVQAVRHQPWQIEKQL